MIGTTLTIVGIVGLAGKAWAVYQDVHDPPQEFSARVAKTRLDTKRVGGKETYTYIVTFFIHEINRYISFDVTQRQFDEIVNNDNGVLVFNYKRRKFVEWATGALPLSAD
ncbi:MAG: hypothetical protein FWG87_01830 [Defluviitaleaceae bacterium]|nr:hypothetical protein [Defluviitaleaceae bacterium]